MAEMQRKGDGGGCGCGLAASLCGWVGPPPADAATLMTTKNWPVVTKVIEVMLLTDPFHKKYIYITR